MPTALLTGVPGFLGRALLPRLLDRGPDQRVVCLVQPRWAAAARDAVHALAAARPDRAGRVDLVEGDIRHPDAGLDEPRAVVGRVDEVFHLAAVYDLTVSPDVAERVNVDGTRRVLELAERAPALRRFHHVSTCYVSGRHEGVFRERDLDVGQTFKNHYEATKYRAEVAVRGAMAGGLPATIYRPAAVVGDAADGATPKLDGAYLFIRLVVRQGRTAFLPVCGDVDGLVVNIVPRDYVMDALAALSVLPASLGRTYHLADPRPDTVGGMLRSIARAADARLVTIPLPLVLVRGVLRWIPGARRLTGIPPEAIDYYDHRGRYDVTNTETDLAGTGVRCPPFSSYVDRLVAFVKANPSLGSDPMV